MIRVLVAGELADLFEPDEQVEVVARVATAEEILGAAQARSPDVIAFDLGLPRLAELRIIDRILAESSAGALVLMTAGPGSESTPLLRAMAVGRIEIVRRTNATARDRHAVMAGVRALGCARAPQKPRAPTRRTGHPAGRRVGVFGLASSTGGPQALARILSELPADLPFPVLVAQHMTPGFVSGMVTWLRRITPLEVAVAVENEVALPGHVYLPNDGCDLELDDRRRMLVRPSTTLYSPSADKLLLSLAVAFGAEAGGAVLTGMGTDGAQGLLAIARAGGVTFAQDEATSVVFGMPKVAGELGAVDSFVALADMSAAIRRCAGAGPEHAQPRASKCR